MQANRSKHWIFESTRESMLKWKRCRNFFHSPIVRINAPKWHSPSFAIGLTPKSVYSKNVPRIPKCNPHAISWPALQSTVNENQGTAKKNRKNEIMLNKIYAIREVWASIKQRIYVATIISDRCSRQCWINVFRCAACFITRRRGSNVLFRPWRALWL